MVQRMGCPRALVPDRQAGAQGPRGGPPRAHVEGDAEDAQRVARRHPVPQPGGHEVQGDARHVVRARDRGG
eukprot:656766-Prymnesium_polylepis.1